VSELREIEGIGDVPEVDTPQKMPPPVARSLLEIERPKPDDRTELLRNRYLCRGGGLLFCGPTGIGKSSWTMQAAILWALGREYFGIKPTRPFKSLFIQAENDEGDLAEFRDGICAGLNLTDEEIKSACKNIFVVREDARSSFRFFNEVVEPLLESQKPDLLWIDPALAYLGGETVSQRDVGSFLRNHLNPLLHKFDCGAVVVHHTNKPPTGKEKPNYQAGDFAYLGSGSAEWANWARAVLAIRSIGSHTVFELRAGKRGARIGWKDATGERQFCRVIGHSKEQGKIYWRDANADEIPPKGRPKSVDADEILELLPDEGLKAGEWKKIAITDLAISVSTFQRAIRALKDADRIIKLKASGKWMPVNKK
jgi:AAA domain